METNKLFALFWKITGLVLVTTVVSCNIITVMNHSKINDTVGRMVTEGIEPKKAGCAVAIANGTNEQVRLYCAIPEYSID